MNLNEIFDGIEKIQTPSVDKYYFDQQLKNVISEIENAPSHVLIKTARVCGLTELLLRYSIVKMLEKPMCVLIINDFKHRGVQRIGRVNKMLSEDLIREYHGSSITLKNGSSMYTTTYIDQIEVLSPDIIICDDVFNEPNNVIDAYLHGENKGKIIRNVSDDSPNMVLESFKPDTTLITMYWELSEFFNINNEPKIGETPLSELNYDDQIKLIKFGIRGNSDRTNNYFEMLGQIKYGYELENITNKHHNP